MEAVKGNKPHVLALPFPAQGHVKPLMKLCSKIAKHGIKVTFVNIERVHEKIVAAAKMSAEEEEKEDTLELVPIPDGLTPEDDPNNTFKLLDTLKKTLPETLTDLIERINSSNPDEKVSCVISDIAIGWILDTARKMELEALLFSPASAAALTLTFHIPRLLEDGILDADGTLKKGEKVMVSDGIPAWGENELSWSFLSNLEIQKIAFESAKMIATTVKKAKLVLISTCSALESSACDSSPNFLPVGPLLETSTRKSCSNSYNFHSEDASCLTWLDSKPPGSVIYVSFGSLAVFSQQQFEELALGLELSGRAFLWVVRLDLANGTRAVYPTGFLDRVSESGKIVEWAPQEKVLSHPSVGCFLTHCGWNSTQEGSSMGVPFLCWPSFSDQFHNQSYICDKWETGLRIDPDENGIRSRHEIRNKIDMVFTSENLKANALNMKELSAKCVSKGGSSDKNFQRFIDHLRN